MFPEKVAKVLQTADHCALATRDRDNVPAVHQGFGQLAGPGPNEVSVIIPEVFAGRLRENLKDNGRAALGFGEGVSHESYQIKGRCVAVRAPTAPDLEAKARAIDSMLGFLKNFPVKVDLLHAMKDAPCVVVTLTVDEIYNQTPGPGAGEKIAVGA
jgi:hypothetical protein